MELIRCDYDKIVQEETPQAIRLASIIKKIFRPATVIDVGCGPGIYVEEFIRLGIDAIGIDVDPRIAGKPNLIVGDILSADGLGTFDLVLCLEVAEHLPESYSDLLVEKLCSLSRTIVFSAAHIGQGGDGHINCQPRRYWVKKFNSNGFVVDEVSTYRLLDDMMSGYHMGWFIMNGMILKRG